MKVRTWHVLFIWSLTAASLSGAIITGAGTQKIGSASAGIQWRDPTVVKTYDPDANNILGSAGYVLFKTNTVTNTAAANDTKQMTLSLPSWVTFAPSTTTNFGQINYGYDSYQNPTAPASSLTVGMDGYTWGLSNATTYPLFTITIGAGAPSHFTLTVATNNIYASSPATLILAQTSGSGSGSASLTSFPSSGYTDANFNSFTVTGAQAGDVYTIEGTTSSDASKTMYIQGFMFDTSAGTSIPMPTPTPTPTPSPTPTPTPILTSPNYTFQSTPIGPLGFVDGMVARTTPPYDRYVRTDVDGAYKWNGTQWISMTDVLCMQQGIGGVLSLALDAGQTNVIYLAASYATGATGGVYKSSDNGHTWSFIGPDVTVSANANYRNVGGPEQQRDRLFRHAAQWALSEHDWRPIVAGRFGNSIRH